MKTAEERLEKCFTDNGADTPSYVFKDLKEAMKAYAAEVVEAFRQRAADKATASTSSRGAQGDDYTVAVVNKDSILSLDYKDLLI